MKLKCKEVIKMLIRVKKKNYKELSLYIGCTEQTMKNKISRGNFKVEDLIQYAEFLGIDIGFKDGDNFYSFLETKKDEN